jgi:hypothetical protein
MIHRPSTEIPHQQPARSAIQIRRRRRIVIAMRRSRASNHPRSSALRREPDNSILPIVAVPETGRGRVLRHVPRVHDGEGAVVGAAARVHLAGAAAAHAGGAAGGVEAGAAVKKEGSQRFVPCLPRRERWKRKIDLPSVTGTVYSRERHAAVGDLEEGFVLQVQGA